MDNYDSYTYNLYDLIARVSGQEPLVLRSDAPRDTYERLQASGSVGKVVISPGPGTPANPSDIGHVPWILEWQVPILGVCLGHQAIAHHYGGVVSQAPTPMHGRVSKVRVAVDDRLFKGIPREFSVVRYHSLAVAPTLPCMLEPLAWVSGVSTAEEDCLMALRHRERPIWGVQFHPESVLSEYGRELMANFLGFPMVVPARIPRPLTAPRPPKSSTVSQSARPYRLHRRLMQGGVPEDLPSIFDNVFYCRNTPCVWLDSAKKDVANFSVMGGGKQAGPLAESLTYSCATRQLTFSSQSRVSRGLEKNETFFDVFNEEVEVSRSLVAVDDIEWDFGGGWVGFTGYELKCEVHSEQLFAFPQEALIDTAWTFVDRFLYIDHKNNKCWLAAMNSEAPERWFNEVEYMFSRSQQHLARPPESEVLEEKEVEFALMDPEESYKQNARRCLDCIRRGESYQLCLTTAFTSPWRPRCPLQLYREMRRSNPAPYGAVLIFGPDLALVSSSPERFMRVDVDGVVEVKPMKGTAPRGATPGEDDQLRRELSSSEKDIAENLMIVDLMRNDLSIVCDVGSVIADKLMEVETYAHYHQLVSSISGRLRVQTSSVECLRQLFPPGSMTGAPKIRSMQLLEDLEKARSRRGPYSGCFGFVSMKGKAAALAVAIRTVVLTEAGTSIGAGGAITILSDPAKEFEEMLVKARPALRALSKMVRCLRVPSLGLSLVADLVETVLWHPEHGVWLFDCHYDRLSASTQALGTKALSRPAFAQLLACTPPSNLGAEWASPSRKLACEPLRVRLALTCDGAAHVTMAPVPFPVFLGIPPSPVGPSRLVVLDSQPSIGPYGGHKTSSRGMYDAARARHSITPTSNELDVVLYNHKREITETTIHNIAVQMEPGAPWLTPPASCGIIVGTLRSVLPLEPRVISMEMWERRHRAIVFNSVRGVIEVITADACKRNAKL